MASHPSRLSEDSPRLAVGTSRAHLSPPGDEEVPGKQNPCHTHLLSCCHPLHQELKEEGLSDPWGLEPTPAQANRGCLVPIWDTVLDQSGWRLGPAPRHGRSPCPQWLVVFSFPLGKGCGGHSEPQLVFIAPRLKKGLNIFLERRGKKNIFSFDPR